MQVGHVWARRRDVPSRGFRLFLIVKLSFWINCVRDCALRTVAVARSSAALSAALRTQKRIAKLVTPAEQPT
jgi:hypothetical protein